jgi:outer membrane receptor for ferrienterochelin and colicins
MSACSKIVLVIFLCLWYCRSNAQHATITILTQEDQVPVEGAIVILKPVENAAGRKQEILFTNHSGQVPNTPAAPSLITVSCLGCETITDTVMPGLTYVFRITKSPVDLDEVVVSGQYDINTSDRSVYRVNVIGAKEIQSMSAQDLTEVLSKQVDMRVSHDNILGSSASINGVSGQNVKILVDGIAVIGRQNGNVDLSQINMNNVERIEIIEGPMSVSYGTDALGGLINIVTKKSSSYPLEGNLNLYYESVGTLNADLAFFYRTGSHAIALSGGRYFFAGFSDPDTSRYQQWKPGLQYFSTLQYNYTGSLLNASVKSEYFNEEIQNKGIPVITPYQAYAFDDYYFTRRINESVFLEKRLRNNATIQLTNGFNNYRQIKNTYRKDLVTLQEELTAGEGTQDTTTFDAWTVRGTYGSQLPGRRINFQAGYDINLQSGRGGTLSSGTNRINDYALFGSLEYEITSNLFVRPGIRVAYNTRYGAPVTPSLNLKYDLRDKYNVRLAYAHGFRAPSLKELDLEFVDANHHITGNDSLEAELSDNISASFSSRNELGPAKLLTEISLFYNNMQNLITLAQTEQSTNSYTYINVNTYKTRGITLTGELRRKSVSIGAGLALLGLYNTLSDTFEIEQFSLTPSVNLNLIAAWPKPALEGAVFLNYTGSTPGFAVNDHGEVYQTFLEAYTILDMSLTKYFLNKRIAVVAGVKNMLNVTTLTASGVGGSFHSADATSVPYALGRYFHASLRIALHK